MEDNKPVVVETMSTSANGSIVTVRRSLLQGKPFDEKDGPTKITTTTDAQGTLLRQDFKWENPDGEAHRDEDKPALMTVFKCVDEWVLYMMWYKNNKMIRAGGLPESYSSLDDEWAVWESKRAVLKFGLHPDAEGKIHGLTRQEAISQWVEPHIPATWKALGLCVEAKPQPPRNGKRTAGSK